MQIEILCRNVDLKNRFLTRYAGSPEMWADGDRIKIPGLTMQITAHYLLFNITSAAIAEEALPLLFNLKPVSSAGQLYEPAADFKLIVTAIGKGPAELLPCLHEVSHLDLERGELLGVNLTEWRSRNVALVARTELALQGGLLVAKIKFATHSRDSQFNCQACVEQISLRKIMAPLSPEFAAVPPTPKITGPLIQARQVISGPDWIQLVNRQPAPTSYCRETNCLNIVFSSDSLISFQEEPDRREIMCQVALSDPAHLGDGLPEMLSGLLGLEHLTVTQQAENLALQPDYLLGTLGFVKEPGFTLFSLANDDFQAVYDIKNLTLSLERTIALKDNEAGSGVSDAITAAFAAMQSFMATVMDHVDRDH